MSDTESRISEADIARDLKHELDRLGDRCVWRSEVWMLCWTHSTRKQADRLRIDFVVELEGRLIGIETKAPAKQAVELGRHLLQCAQYSAGVIAANRSDVPQRWIGKPLAGVFLRTRLQRNDAFMERHALSAHRLYGPANVGFFTVEERGICLRLSGERFWTEWSGWHQGMLTKTSRIGSGQFVAEG